MATLRRYLSLCALLFWQGGFLFYATVVIPIAGKVLQGRLHLRAEITGEATDWLNGLGVGVLALLLWDVACSIDGSRFRNRGRGACWTVLFLTLAGLFALHYWLDLLDPPESRGPSDLVAFGVVHTLYVVIALVQSAAALIYLGMSVRAWRAEDETVGREKEVREGEGVEEK